MLNIIKNDSRREALNYDDIVKYRVPIYHKSKKSHYVYWYVLDPDSVIDGNPRLKRLVKKFNHIKDRKERDEAALRFRDEVAIKLRQGWNPLVVECGKKGFSSFDSCLQRYERYITKQLKDGAVKRSTFDSYRSRLNQFKAFNNAQDSPIVYAYQLDTAFLESFLEHIYLDHNTSARTRNNYLNWVSSFCGYLKSCGYIDKNPSEEIHRLRVTDKIRKPINAEDMKALHDYLEVSNKPYLLACSMLYYTLVRPNELTYLRLRDFNLKEQSLFLSGSFTKNRKDAVVTVPAVVIKLMIDLHIFDYPDSYFLFGRDFLPSSKKAEGRIFREYFLKVRDALGWPEYYQFYSLKDSGITDAIDRVGLTVTKDQARHYSIEVTNHYVRKEQMKAHDELKDYTGNL